MKQMNFMPSTVACFVHDDRISAKLLLKCSALRKIMKVFFLGINVWWRGISVKINQAPRSWQPVYLHLYKSFSGGEKPVCGKLFILEKPVLAKLTYNLQIFLKSSNLLKGFCTGKVAFKCFGVRKFLFNWIGHFQTHFQKFANAKIYGMPLRWKEQEPISFHSSSHKMFKAQKKKWNNRSKWLV